ncbi:hypothetical protein OESDEN_18824 [Oesophagostomum dentatum]|uniref:Uncharacterized protein n=1 Tax=Oesophagostomum dentatum TaxID=61180 RepID=A0A0B1SE31_OESDE|nr:hypothetical protein OESDEN_18824 [Oesophagostomum dentatum]
MVDYAEQQRKQIEANRREVDRRQALLSKGGTDAIHEIKLLRRDLAEEEAELRRLSELEYETRNLTKKNSDKEAELNLLSAELRQQQSILRVAAGRVEVLRRQIEELYRRRQAAAAAALTEQRKMQQAHRVQEGNRSATSAERPRASIEELYRRRQAAAAAALTEQRKMQQAHRVQDANRSATSAERPRASVEPFHVNPSLQHEAESDAKNDKCTVIDVSLDR